MRSNTPIATPTSSYTAAAPTYGPTTARCTPRSCVRVSRICLSNSHRVARNDARGRSWERTSKIRSDCAETGLRTLSIEVCRNRLRTPPTSPPTDPTTLVLDDKPPPVHPRQQSYARLESAYGSERSCRRRCGSLERTRPSTWTSIPPRPASVLLDSVTRTSCPAANHLLQSSASS